MIDNELWFVGKDAAAIFGYECADNAIRKHIDGDDKLMHQISASGQNRETGIINQSGLYSLLPAMHVEEDDALKQGFIDSMGRMQETTLISADGLFNFADLD